MTITLWGDGASRASVVHWMLHELNLTYEKKLIGSRTGETQTAEFLARNPAGKIPVLEDGDLRLTESAAIISYLGLRYGDGTIVPRAVEARAKYDQWCFFAMTELDAQSCYIVHKHTTLAYVYGEAPQAVEVAKQTFLKQVGVLGTALADGRRWILGDNFSAADMLLANGAAWGQRYDLELPEQVAHFVTKAQDRPAFSVAASAAARAADALPD